MAAVSRSVSYWAVSGQGTEGAVGQTVLRYDTDDPYAVQLDFGIVSDGKPTVWTFARDILADGLTNWAGYADVTCWTDRVWYYIGLRSPDGQCVIKFIAEAVRAFIVDAEDLVPYGAEAMAFDAELDALLKDDAR